LGGSSFACSLFSGFSGDVIASAPTAASISIFFSSMFLNGITSSFSYLIKI